MIGSLPYIRRLFRLYSLRHDVNPSLTALSLHRHKMPWSSQVLVRTVIRLFISVCKLYKIVISRFLNSYANALLAEKSFVPVKICQAILANLLAKATMALCFPRRWVSALNQQPRGSVLLPENRLTALAPWMSKTLSSEQPFLVMLPSLILPPELD